MVTQTHRLNPETFEAVTASFWEQTAARSPEECWLWTGNLFGNSGYPRLMIRNSCVAAHRFSYELHNGPFSVLLCVCHRCDEPLCVNPSHLFLGTHTENFADMRQKRRHRSGHRTGSRGSLAILTPEAVRDIRANPGQPLRYFANKYGVGHPAIHKVRAFKTWKEV